MVCGLPICSVCNASMDKGYCVDYGYGYYCSRDCLHTDYTPEQWDAMCEDDDDGNYYTTWEPCADCLADGCGANCGAGRA